MGETLIVRAFNGQGWSYVRGYYLVGIEKLSKASGDRRFMDYIVKCANQAVNEQGEFTLPPSQKLDCLDNLLQGISLIATYEYTHEERFKNATMQIRKIFDTYPREDGQFHHGIGCDAMWIDGVFMGQEFLLRYASSIGDADYCYSEVAKQLITHARHTEKDHSGLYLHAWTHLPKSHAWANPETGLSPEVWSEGLGWYSLILSDAVAEFPKNHPQRPALEDIYRRLAAALKRTQDPASGGWFMIVDKGDKPDNWIDPSGTAMFVYALKRGIDGGFLDRNEYSPVVERGYKKLLEFAFIDKRGQVDVNGGGPGIGVKSDYEEYVTHKRVLNANETVGGFLWATTLMEQDRLRNNSESRN